ncbi:MAG: threonine/serine dehydratase [Myxococcota bacterium]
MSTAKPGDTIKASDGTTTEASGTIDVADEAAGEMDSPESQQIRQSAPTDEVPIGQFELLHDGDEDDYPGETTHVTSVEMTDMSDLINEETTNVNPVNPVVAARADITTPDRPGYSTTAMARLAGLVRRTPLVIIPAVQVRIGPVSLKLENLQRTGSFKLRGAVRKIASLTAEEQAVGVVAASAGNHGAGVALAASRLGVKATVVVSANTPQVKRDLIASLGAQVVVDGANYDEAEAMAKIRASAAGAPFLSPYDDETIIAGNGGDLADEILKQVPALSRVVAPVGGGGLIAGLARRLAPRGIEVIGVQPENNCAMYDSLRGNKALTVYNGRDTLAEGCEGPVAERTFAIAQQYVKSVVLVSEAAIRRAVAFCYVKAGTVVEPTGAVPMAGFLEGVVSSARRGTTVCILCGGNIEPDLLDNILATEKV